jgi:antimicrobial peptide system SdpA family protein
MPGAVATKTRRRRPSEHVLRRRGTVALATMGAFGVVAAYGADASAPANTVDLPGPAADVVRAVVPEGWSFFTRDPREEDIRAWRFDGSGRWTSASLGVNAGPVNSFGLGRRSRAQGVELGLVYSRTTGQRAQWTDCTDAVPACLAGLATVATVTNPTPHPTLCGEIGISRQRPLPWAWAAEGVDEEMPARVTRVRVTC